MELTTSFDYYSSSSSSSISENYLDELFAAETATISTNVTKPVKAQLLLYDILIPGLGTVIIILNLAVVISSGLILKKGSQPRSTYLFLGNVALCDMLTGVAVFMGQLYPKSVRTQLSCAFQLGLIVSSTVTSIYSVGLIAIDRYLYIIHGLQYQQWIYPTRARILILSTWIIGCVVGFLPVMGWSGDTENGRICWFIKLVPKNLVMMTCIIGILPILLVIVLYSIILYHAVKKVIQLQRAGGDTRHSTPTMESKIRINVARTKQNVNKSQEELEEQEPKRNGNIFRRMFVKKSNIDVDLKSPTKLKAIKIVLFVTGSFIITWVPYFTASFIYVNCDPAVAPAKCRTLQVLIASPLAILGFCNSLLNPFIYAWWHKGFRNFVKNLIAKKGIIKNQSSSDTKSTKSTNVSSGQRKLSEQEDEENEIRLEPVALQTHL